MSDRTPLTLFTTNRAQCPDCGSPLDLPADSPTVQCRYCGGLQAVERRMRTIEPIIAGTPETASSPEHAPQWRPSHLLQNHSIREEAHCPTCGVMFDVPADPQAIASCPHCGVRSKLERRLVRSGPVGRDAIVPIVGPEDDARQARQTNEAVDKVLAERDPLRQAALAHEFSEAWLHMNRTAALRLPELCDLMRRQDPRIEVPLGNVVRKLLCEGDGRLVLAVLRCAENYVFDVNGSRELLFTLGMGSGLCLKLLLDAADHAAAAGAYEYAATALWAGNYIFERHYEHRDMAAQTILYRLLYMTGPVQAWALQLAQGQMGLGYRYPAQTLLHFIDDCAAERPELIPHIDKCFYTGSPTSDGEYLARLMNLHTLLTPHSRAALLRHWTYPHEGIGDGPIADAIAFLLPLAAPSLKLPPPQAPPQNGGSLNVPGGAARREASAVPPPPLEPHPLVTPAAITAIIHLVEHGNQVPKPIHDMVQKHRDALPEEIRRAYLRRVDKSEYLSAMKPDYWQPEREGPLSPFDAQLKQWHDLWKENLIKAVDARNARQAAARLT